MPLIDFSDTSSVYVIAEAGVNHNGSKEMAFQLIDAAAEAGADAVKFQTFSAKKLASKSIGKAAYQIAATGNEEGQFEMLQKLELPLEWHFELQRYARNLGIEFLSTAFDDESLAFLATMDLPLFKIPSGELTNLPLLLSFARTQKPLVLSTGMATLAEVEQAIAVVAYGRELLTEPRSMHDVVSHWSSAKERNNFRSRQDVVLLHCTSQYPTPLCDVNLYAMDTLKNAFNLPVGYSDHTEGNLVPLAAVARGARIIEKHFTLNRDLPGPDHKASLMPQELADLVRDIRGLTLAMGDGGKFPQPSELLTRVAVRQKVTAARPLKTGHILQRADLTSARIKGDIEPGDLWSLVGTAVVRDYEAGDAISR